MNEEPIVDAICRVAEAINRLATAMELVAGSIADPNVLDDRLTNSVSSVAEAICNLPHDLDNSIIDGCRDIASAIEQLEDNG